MAGKRKRKKGKSGWISKLFSWGFKALPIALYIAFLTGVGFGVRELLYADAGLVVNSFSVYPKGALSTESLNSLKNRWAGEPMLSVNSVKIAEEIEKSPRIKTANIVKKFPHSIEIHVERRVPYVYAQWSNRSTLVVAQDGMVLEEISQLEDDSLTLLKFFSSSPKRLSIGRKVNSRIFYEMIDLSWFLKNQSFLGNDYPKELKIDAAGNVGFHLGEGVEVKLGKNLEHQKNAILRLESLLEKESLETIDYIDLRYKRAVVKRK